MKKSKIKKVSGKNTKSKFLKLLIPLFWFFVGFLFAFFCICTFLLLYFRLKYDKKIIPGVFIGNIYVGDKTPNEVEKIFKEKNNEIGKTKIYFTYDQETKELSASDLGIGYDSKLISKQAEGLGKHGDPFSNIYQIANSYINGVYLKPSTKGNFDKVVSILVPIEKKVYKEPVNALFSASENRIVEFRESQDGLTINYTELEEDLFNKIPEIIALKKSQTFKIPVKIIEPEITTEEANSFGIEEEIGYGSSKFSGSIPNRIFNVSLAASRINGVLLSPGEEFSFAKYLGDVSKYTGYKEAYVIENGKTVLGDGGGVCQVSTTLFRAVLNSGLPITERHAHAYRVGYYEQDTLPGIDATVYVPSVDFKFKNTTGKHILIQSHVDSSNMAMSFTLYGKKDGREITLTNPVITSESPAPETEYQDDPTLPIGTLKQIDYAARGARTTFTRVVVQNGKIIINETFNSNYRPWRAVFLRGTKQG